MRHTMTSHHWSVYKHLATHKAGGKLDLPHLKGFRVLRSKSVVDTVQF